MTNTNDDNQLFVPVTQGDRPASRFPRDIIAMQHRLSELKAATATGVDEDLRRSRIFDLSKAIETAMAERDAQPDVETVSGESSGLTLAPRHMTAGRFHR